MLRCAAALHCCCHLLQVKIAELPLDSFRMLQALEWEDQFSSPNPPAQEHPMPLTRSGSGKNLADKVKGLENGSEQQQGEARLVAACGSCTAGNMQA
jgi:hypothetical protein